MTTDTALALHLANRLGYGPVPGDVDRIAALGADEWIERQLAPQSLPLPSRLTDRLAAFATLDMSPGELFVKYMPLLRQQQQAMARTDRAAAQAAQAELRTIGTDAVQSRILRALYSPRQLEESLT